MPDVRQGELLAVLSAGAYGFSMSDTPPDLTPEQVSPEPAPKKRIIRKTKSCLLYTSSGSRM